MINKLDQIDNINIEELLRNQDVIRKIYHEREKLYDASQLEIRESITGACNFRCRYCSETTSRLRDKSYAFWLKINAAVAALGMEGIHHTGGEPTVRKNLDKYIKYLHELGYKSQVITTNGSNPDLLNKCIDAGATRFNISLDTLDKKRFSEIARLDESIFDNVMESIQLSKNRLQLYKINMVVMRNNFDEIADMFHFAQENNAVIRFIELYPYGPSIESGMLGYAENHVSKAQIIEKLKEIGKLKITEVDGINAVPRYYNVEGYDSPIAIISPNWIKGGATCGKGRCVRLRGGASGNITYCNNIQPISGDELDKMTIIEVADVLAEMVYKKNQRVQLENYPAIHPFKYKALRFGKDAV